MGCKEGFTAIISEMFAAETGRLAVMFTLQGYDAVRGYEPDRASYHNLAEPKLEPEENCI